MKALNYPRSVCSYARSGLEVIGSCVVCPSNGQHYTPFAKAQATASKEPEVKKGSD